MWQNGFIGPDIYETPKQTVYLTRADAVAKARRAFIYAAVIFGALGFAAGAAFASNTASFNGTGCTLVPVTGQAHVAEARCHNTLTGGQPYTEADMTAGDMTANVAIYHGPGDVPDSFTVTPMPGFYAVPIVLVLDEGADGVVLIYEFAGS